MKNPTRLFAILILVVVLLAACNIPRGASGGEGASLTAAAQTVEAQFLTLTQQAQIPITPSFTSVPAQIFTLTPPPTLTGVASATPVCDLGKFISDVTIPDGTVMLPGQAFTKTWRLQNIGVCTWTGYSLVFDSGDVMGGPASVAIGTTPSNGTVDVSVNLTAPATPGNYRGYWRVRNASGVLLPIVNGYQGKSFYVDIKVQSPTPTVTSTLPPAIAQVTLSNIYGEGGQVRSDGTVLAPPNTGDIESNAAAQAFFSFDMTAIPAGATITKVVVDFSSFDTLGNPWSLGDGCVRAYVQNYGTLDAGDFFPGDPTGAVIRWCGAAELGSVFESADMKSVVQNAVGSSRLQLRVQFRAPTTSNNGIADMIRFGTVKLIVTYQ